MWLVMPKYITWEASRGRWVFQLRIPEYARPHFSGRTTIRRHLGAIPEALAAAKASQLVDHFKTVFDQYKPAFRTINHGIRGEADNSRVSFVLDAAIGTRFVATWQMRESERFKAQMDSLRSAQEETWGQWENKLTRSLEQARTNLRRLDVAILNNAISEIQEDLGVLLESTPDAFANLAEEFNSARVSFLADCLDVIRGDRSINALFPDRAAQLPLTCLWGDPARRLVEYWEARSKATRGFVNPKTHEKYAGITEDLTGILGRRPVQNVSESDIKALIKLWAGRGNGGGTINDKLRIMRQLVRPFDKSLRIAEMVTQFLTKAEIPHAARLPFTDRQLAMFADAIFPNPKIHEDDKMLVTLMLLLGARIEEIYQLRTEDVEPAPYGWTIRFADHRQTGHGDAELKNNASARRLPLTRGVISDFDHWLDKRLSASGYLFPNGSRNRYGIRSAAASQRLNRLLRKLFPDDRRLVLQSTRNTAGRVMRRSNTDPRVRQRLLGHADISIHDKHYDPAALLDDQDLLEGADAIANYLSSLLRESHYPLSEHTDGPSPDSHYP